MTTEPRPRPRLQLVLSTLFLAVVVGVAVLPNLGVVSAASSCLYNCNSQSNASPNYGLYYAAIAVLALVALALAVLIIMRRRRPPTPPPLAEAEPAMGGPSGPGDADAMVAAEAPVAAAASVSPAPSVPPGASAAYMEGPEDIGASAPVLAGAAAAPPAEGGEADIDSLMQELDKISGEILKRPAAKKDGTPPAGSDEGVENP